MGNYCSNPDPVSRFPTSPIQTQSQIYEDIFGSDKSHMRKKIELTIDQLEIHIRNGLMTGDQQLNNKSVLKSNLDINRLIPFFLNIYNDTEDQLTIYELDFSKKRQSQKTIEKNTAFDVETFLGIQWVIEGIFGPLAGYHLDPMDNLVSESDSLIKTFVVNLKITNKFGTRLSWRNKILKKEIEDIKTFRNTQRAEIKKIVSKAFEVYDADHSGYLEWPEVKSLFDSIYSSMGCGKILDSEQSKIFEIGDTKNAGRMTYDEQMEILGPMTIIKKNFLVFDADKSGALDFQEMRKLIDTISIEFQIPKFTDSQLTGLMIKNDKNHDDIMTFDELFLLILPIFCNKTSEKTYFFSTKSAFGRMTAQRPAELRDNILRMFNKYDLDQSGNLDASEMKKLMDDTFQEMGVSPILDSHLKSQIKIIDTDQNNEITFEEMFAVFGPMFTIKNSFQFYDVNKRGYLDHDEIKMCLNLAFDQLGLDALSFKEYEALLKKIDHNDDGKFEFDEVFLGVASQISKSPNPKKRFKMPSKATLKQMIQDTFISYDSDSSGLLDMEEIRLLIKDFYSQLKCDPISEAKITNLCNKYDTDQNGLFSFEELFNMIGPLSLVKTCFGIYDDDSNGYLDFEEIRRLLIDIYAEIKGQKISDEEIDKIFKDYDTDGDGKFNFDELYEILGPILLEKNFIIRFQIPSRFEILNLIKYHFDKSDIDQSGFLDKMEIKILYQNILAEMNIDVVTEAQIEHMIMKADSNGDGKWSFAELFRILGPVTLAGKLFKLYDTKEKRYFSFDETKCLLNDIYCEFNIENGLDESELDKVILGHDLNGDGKYTFDEVFLIVGPILDRENFFWDNGINVTGKKFTQAEIKNLAKEAYTEIDIKRKGFLRSAKIKQWVNWIYLKMGVGKITTKQLVTIMENSSNPKGFADEWPFEELIKLIGPVALVKSLFKNHDGDKTGYLNLARVKVLLREVIHDLRKIKPEEGEVSKIITKTGDANGRFSFEELYQIIAPMISKKHFSIQFVMPTKLELKKMTKRMFRTYDTDKSDYLDYEETARMLRDTFEELNGDSDFLTSAQILNLTKMIDIDLDGKIVYDEQVKILGPMHILKTAFSVYDSDNSGLLEVSEIKYLFIDSYKQLGYNEPNLDEQDEIIANADSDGDGKFSFDELFRIFAPKIHSSIGLRFSMPSQEEISDLMDELFQKYDTDKSGYLDKLEIIEMLKDTYRDIGATFLSQSHLQDIMNTIDQNGDGKFSYDEVLRYQGPITISKKAFELYDTEKTGILGKNQIRKLISDIYCELGLQTLTENQLEGILKAIDEDEDGDVTFNELIKVLKPILESSQDGEHFTDFQTSNFFPNIDQGFSSVWRLQKNYTVDNSKIAQRDYTSLQGDCTLGGLVAERFAGGKIQNSKDLLAQLEFFGKYVLRDVLSLDFLEQKWILGTYMKDLDLEKNFQNFMVSDLYIVCILKGSIGSGKSSFLRLKFQAFWRKFLLGIAGLTGGELLGTFGVDGVTFLPLYLDLRFCRRIFGSDGFLQRFAIKAEVFVNFVKGKNVLVMLDGYDEIGYSEMLRLSDGGKVKDINFVDEIFQSLRSAGVGAIKIILSVRTDWLEARKKSEIVNIFSLKELGGLFYGKYLTEISTARFSFEHSEKRVIHYMTKILNFLHSPAAKGLYGPTFTFWQDFQPYIYQIRQKSLSMYMNGYLWCKILLFVIPKLQTDQQLFSRKHFSKLYTDLHMEDKFYRLGIDKNLEKIPIIKPASYDRAKICLQTWRERLYTICTEFAYIMVRYRKLLWQPASDYELIWKHLFQIDSPSTPFTLQPFFPLLKCLPLRIIQTAFSPQRPTYEIFFSDELTKSFWVAAMIKKFNAPFMYEQDFQKLFRILEKTPISVQIKEFLGDSREDQWLMAGAKWYRQVYGKDCSFYYKNNLNMEKNGFYDAEILGAVGRGEYKESEIFLDTLRLMAVYNPLSEIDMKLQKNVKEGITSEVISENAKDPSKGKIKKSRGNGKLTKSRDSTVEFVKRLVFDLDDWAEFFYANVASEIKDGVQNFRYFFFDQNFCRLCYNRLARLLEEPCEIWADNGVKVLHTHFLFYIPKSVFGQTMTLALYEKLLMKQNRGQVPGLWYSDDFPKIQMEDQEIQGGYWLLMTRDAVPGTRAQGFDKAKRVIENAGYLVPTYFEVLLAVTLNYVKFSERILKGDVSERFSKNAIPEENTLSMCTDLIDGKRCIIGCFDQYNQLTLDCMDPERLEQFHTYIGLCGVKRIDPQNNSDGNKWSGIAVRS